MAMQSEMRLQFSPCNWLASKLLICVTQRHVLRGSHGDQEAQSRPLRAMSRSARAQERTRVFQLCTDAFDYAEASGGGFEYFRFWRLPLQPSTLIRLFEQEEKQMSGRILLSSCLRSFEHRKGLHGNCTLALLFFQLISVEMSLAANPDPKLLSLVPPGAQIVAGITIRPARGQPDGFLLVSLKNLVDRSDFISLAGVDDSMIIDQMVFAAGGSDPSKLGEHSLLMSGHFDQTRIFKSAVENGASVSEFRGFQVSVQQPFERELGKFKDVRWLAVIDSNVALFGTRVSVQQELERRLAASAVDPSLVQKLARLRRDNATWSVLHKCVSNEEVEQLLGSLDPILVNLVHVADSFQFGVRYGRKVEVEYEVTVPSSAPEQAVSNSPTPSFAREDRKGFASLHRVDLTGDRASVRGVVKVAIAQYEEWMAEVARTGLIHKGAITR